MTNLSCGSKTVDPRTVIPADSLIYLETADLGRMLEAITSNPKFIELAKTKPDTSALDGIRLSIAVTGFQTSEEPVSENSILNFKPRFVAVAETNAWNYQALAFTENKLGEFINQVYGGEVELVTSDKHNGTYFTWTAKDGRKAYALVRGSLILFGNDETAIDNCVNVMNGGAESIAKNTKVSAFPLDALAAGYVSKDGVAQIANIAAVSLAIGAGEEGAVKNFISRVLPEIARKSVTEVSWTSRRHEPTGRIEDRYAIGLEPETAKVLSETVVPGTDSDPDMSRFMPTEFVSTTRYNLKDARIAWRSLLLTTRTKTDQGSGGLLSAFSSSLFEPYGIEDPEAFLSAVDEALETVRFDPEGEEVAVTARIRDLNALKKSLAKELDLSKPPSKFENADIWRSADGEVAVGTVENRVVVGEMKSVERCLSVRNGGMSPVTVSADARLGNSSAPVVTYGSEVDSEADLIGVLSERKDENQPLVQTYTVESRFNQNGLERRTVSDFGLIGAIIGRLNAQN